MNTDFDLLREYAGRQSEEAFAALVSRHLNLVFSAALRKTANPHAAEEITQTVFVILARKAKSLGPKIVLSGWLYQTTRLTAANYLRTEMRRTRREQEAYMQSLSTESEPDLWPQIAPLLEDAMAWLGEKDRNAVVLRFFENKSLRDVGSVLGVSEDAAKVRVARAVEKLRVFFGKRGIALSGGVIVSAVSANSVHAAPAGLAATTAGAAVKGATAATSISALVNSTLQTMTWLKLKTAIAIGIALLTGGGAVTFVVAETRGRGMNSLSRMTTRSMLIVPKASVGKIRAGMTAQQVVAELGEPDRRTGTGRILSYVGEGFTVVLDQDTGAVRAVFCGDALGVEGPMVKAFKGRTAEGIGMGSSRDDVVKAYGQPTEATESRPGQQGLKYASLGLNIGLYNGKVVHIAVEF